MKKEASSMKRRHASKTTRTKSAATGRRRYSRRPLLKPRQLAATADALTKLVRFGWGVHLSPQPGNEIDLAKLNEILKRRRAGVGHVDGAQV